MDFQNALLLIAAIFGVVELIKSLLPSSVTKNSKVIVGVVLIVSFGITMLVAHTAWAHEQVIGSKPLDELNLASQVLVSLLAAGTAAFGSNFLYSLRNIGQNQLSQKSQELQDKAMAAAVERQAEQILGK